MKKFLGVIVALTMCVCLLVPTAFAGDAIGSIDLEGLLGDLTNADLTAIFNDMGITDVNVDDLLADIQGGDQDALAMLEDALAMLEGSTDTTPGDATETTAADSGSVDLGAIEGIVGGDTSAITDMLGGLTSGDMSSLMDSISGAFSGAGIDLGSFDLGSFDIATIVGSLSSGSDASGDAAADGDTASGATDTVSGIVDTLMGGLEALGLDTSMIEGVLDNEIVNFFANMYIGYIGEVEETTTADPETTTEKPAVVTTETPKTGDTSAVIAAIATISVASAAAFVCLKKKEN